jgi:hypothetical protein
MNLSFSEKFIAYLALVSGLTISVVAEYYSILGLTTIFPAAVIPVVIMGIVLGIGKITATLWLKQNWNIAPWSLRIYLSTAIMILMLITSMGIFGLLSKAHSDQSLVSGDVLAKIAIYDEKIKTAKENIEADRKQLKQMDEAVDQVLARSTTEEGASRSNAIRKAQARDRNALAKSIETNQRLIATLNDEAAPIRAEIRKVEAEVGPLKYIATFVYGETDNTILEKAVTWVIIIIVFVFDPLAVILLLASQISFQHFRNKIDVAPIEEKIEESVEGDNPLETGPVVDVDQELIVAKSVEQFDITKYPYLFKVPTNRHPPGIEPVGPLVYNSKIEDADTDSRTSEKLVKERIAKERASKVSFYVNQAKEGRMDLSEIPEEFLAEVKSRV